MLQSKGTCTAGSPGQNEVFLYLLEMLLPCSKTTYPVVNGDLEGWNSCSPVPMTILEQQW